MKLRQWLIAPMLAALVLAGGVTGAQVVGRLSGIRGTVEVQHGRQPARRADLSAVLQPGDVVTVRKGALADLVLTRTQARFRLASGSRVRVESERLQLLVGPPPQSLNTGAGANFTSALLEPRGLGQIVRATDADPRFGPRAPSPVFAQRSWNFTLHWFGPLDPVALQDPDMKLRVRIQTLDRTKTLLNQSVSRETTEMLVPEGTLHPGVWYVWSVTVEGARGSGNSCGGPLRLLSAQEQTAFQGAERQAEQARRANPEDAAANRRLGHVYERFGLVREALSVYVAAQRIQPDPQTARIVDRLETLVNGK